MVKIFVTCLVRVPVHGVLHAVRAPVVVAAAHDGDVLAADVPQLARRHHVDLVLGGEHEVELGHGRGVQPSQLQDLGVLPGRLLAVHGRLVGWAGRGAVAAAVPRAALALSLRQHARLPGGRDQLRRHHARRPRLGRQHPGLSGGRGGRGRHPGLRGGGGRGGGHGGGRAGGGGEAGGGALLEALGGAGEGGAKQTDLRRLLLLLRGSLKPLLLRLKPLLLLL